MTTLEPIFITLALLLPPLVLWRCRKFCEKHPSTVPVRTVPLGCLTVFWLMLFYSSAIPWLYYEVLEKNPPHWLDYLKDLPILLLGVPLGIAVIVFLSKRLIKDKERPHGCLYPLVFVGALIVACAISCCCSMIGFMNKESRDWSTIFLPRLQDCRLAFEQRPSHPFLAEYDYRIRLRYGENQAYFQLWPNTGGCTFINVYRIADDKLLLKDKDASYVIDSTQKKVYLIRFEINDDKSEGTDIHFAVPLSEKSFDSLGGYAKDLEVDFTDGSIARAVPYDVDISHREYIGCVMDYSFYTPDEQPEGEGHPRYRDQ